MAEENKTNFISLTEATRYCPYTQEYLSLRARQGKLKAMKIGRNWVTKKDWLEEYLKKVEDYNNNLNNNHLKKKESLSLTVKETTDRIRIWNKEISQFLTFKLRSSFALALTIALLIAGTAFEKENLQNVFEKTGFYLTRTNQGLKQGLNEELGTTAEGLKGVSKEGRFLIKNLFQELKTDADKTYSLFWELNQNYSNGLTKTLREASSYTYIAVETTEDFFNSLADNLQKFSYSVSNASNIVIETTEAVFSSLANDFQKLSYSASKESKKISEVVSNIDKYSRNVSRFIDKEISAVQENLSSSFELIAAITSNDVWRYNLNNFRSFGQWLGQGAKDFALSIKTEIAKQMSETKKEYLVVSDSIRSVKNNVFYEIARIEISPREDIEDFRVGINIISNGFRQKLNKTTNSLFTLLRKIQEIVTRPFEGKEIVVEKTVPAEEGKEIENLKAQNEFLREKIEKLEKEGLTVKEIIREVEVSKITKVEPIKEVTKEITKVDDKSLADIKSQLATFAVWGTDIENLREITKKLQVAPSYTYAPTAPVYIASQGLQVGGTGNFASLGVSGMAGVQDLGVGGSASIGSDTEDKLTVNATSTFVGPATFRGGLIVGSSALTIDGNGNLSTTGNLTVGGSLTITGATALTSFRLGTSTTAGYVLTTDATGVGTWQAATGGGGIGVHNLLSASHPDTTAASPVLGDILYGDATPSWTKLTGNITATKKFLTQTGTGAVSTAPGWDTIAIGDLPTITVAKGGLNLTSIAAGSILAANSADTYSAITSASDLKVLQNNAGTISWAATTGTGSIVLASSPALTTPSLGAATATSINGLTLTSSTGIITLTNAKTLTVSDSTTLAINSITFAGTEALTLAAAKNVTFSDAFATSGAFAITLTATGTTTVTLPTTGTLATTSDLGSYVPTSRNVSTTSPLSGGGNLSADRTLTLAGLSSLGTANYVVGVNSGATGWEYKQLVQGSNITITHGAGSVTIAAAAGLGAHNLLSASHPDTTAASPVLGDILYGDATPSWTKLTGNITATKKFLTQTGTGAVSTAPGWDTIAIGDLPTITPAKGGTGVVNDSTNTLTFSGNYGLTLTLSNTTSLTLPTSGTVTALGNTTTGTGSIVLASSPALTTPSLGAATATSINGLTLTSSTGIITLTNAKTLTVSDSTTLAINSITFAGTEALTLAAAKNVTFSDAFATSGAFAITLTATGTTTVTLPTTGTLATTSNKLSDFAATSSAELLGVISDEVGSGLLVFGTAPTFTTSITAPLVIGGTATTSTLTLRSTSGVGTTGADIIFQTGSNGLTEAMRILNSGYVGIGDASPAALLTVGNGDLFQVSSSGNVTFNQTSPTISIGNTGTLTFNDGSNTLMSLTDTGGSPSIAFTTAGGTDAFVIGVDVLDSDKFKIGTSALTTNTRLTIDSSGDVGIGDTTPDALFDVEKSGATVAIFNRTSDDGTIISFQQAGTEEGTISVSDVTVSYNGFTASHYAWTEEVIEPGMLVSLTGQNKHFHNNQDSELIYGVAKSTIANDSKILGAFLTLQNPSEPASLDNPYLIAALGNMDTWVVDNGENIEIGDYLISSDIPGHAMKDKGDYEVSYIIARAFESIDWTEVSETIDGRKHKKISVSLENFIRYNNLNLTSEGLLPAPETAGTETGSIFESFVGKIKQALASLGLAIENGIARVQKLIAGSVDTEKLKVGTSEKPNGITIYDEDTGQPYCIKIKDGQMINTPGECDTSSPNSSPIEQPVSGPQPGPQPALEPAPEPQPAPEPELQPSPEPQPEPVPTLEQTPEPPATGINPKLQPEPQAEPQPETAPLIP